MKEINKILQRSTELAKVLANTLSAQTLDNAGKVRINKQIGNLHCQVTAVEEMLKQISDEYAVEVNNGKLIIWERKLLDLTLRNNLLNMKERGNALPFSCDNIAAL